MRNKLLAALLALAPLASVQAQEGEAAPPPGPAEAKPAEPQAPAPQRAPVSRNPFGSVQAPKLEAGDPKSADLGQREPALKWASEDFFRAIVARDSARVLAHCALPFSFEGRSIGAPDDVRRRWEAALSSKPVDRLKVYNVELLTPEDAEKRFGKAPEKLSGWPMKGGVVAVGNLGGRPAIVLWKKNGAGGWSAVAFHD